MSNAYRSVLESGGVTPTGDAVAADVLAGKTFSNANAVGLTGTMVNRGAVSQTIQPGSSYTIPEGYHNGSGTVTAGRATEYKASCVNLNNSSVDNGCGFNFSKAQLNGFTTITIACTKAITNIRYSVDSTSWNDVQVGSTPFTIPSFNNNLLIYATFGQSTHEFVEVTATLS